LVGVTQVPRSVSACGEGDDATRAYEWSADERDVERDVLFLPEAVDPREFGKGDDARKYGIGGDYNKKSGGGETV
jgi:hypothetical protein